MTNAPSAGDGRHAARLRLARLLRDLQAEGVWRVRTDITPAGLDPSNVSRLLKGDHVSWRTTSLIIEHVGALVDEAAAATLHDELAQIFPHDERVAVAPKRGKAIVSQVVYAVAASHPLRPYAFIDEVHLTRPRKDQIEARIVRLHPPAQVGLAWTGTGHVTDTAVFLTYRPLGTGPLRGGLHPVSSSGTMALVSEGDTGWAGSYQRQVAGASGLVVFPFRWYTDPLHPAVVGALGRVAVLDVDNSLRSGWLVDDVLRILDDSGIPGAQQALASVAGLLDRYKRGQEPRSHDHLVDTIGEIYACTLAGLRPDRIASILHENAHRALGDGRRHIRRSLVEALAARGVRSVLLSGAPSEAVALLAEQIGCGEFHALECETDGGDDGSSPRYTGQVSRNHGLSREKARVCHDLQRRQCVIELGVGDSSSDRPLWDAARVAVAVNPARDTDLPARPEPFDVDFPTRVEALLDLPAWPPKLENA